MANTIVGKVLSVGQTVNVSKQKEFLKRELVLDCSRYDEYTGEKRENYVTLSFNQKHVEDLNGLTKGELVEVTFILNGRKYEKDGQTKYITDIVGYKVERRGASDGSKAAQPVPEQPLVAPPPAPTDMPQEPETQGEMPF